MEIKKRLDFTSNVASQAFIEFETNRKAVEPQHGLPKEVIVIVKHSLNSQSSSRAGKKRKQRKPEDNASYSVECVSKEAIHVNDPLLGRLIVCRRSPPVTGWADGVSSDLFWGEHAE
jgi:hypothetical protein